MNLNKLYEKSLNLESLSSEEALFIINTPDANLEQLLTFSNEIKLKHVGKKVLLCGIINARSGKCSEDCSFCAQSAHHKTDAKVYPMLSKDEILDATNKAKQNHVQCFSIVTSGKGAANSADFQTVLETIKEVTGLNRCVSLGILSKEQFMQLKEAGLNKFHHNLETAESFFPKMCSTHTYADRVETIKAALSVGLKVCSGGIFGIGESTDQRVELGMAIRELDIESIPINILHPVKGTKLYGAVTPIRPEDILKLIACYRFLMPTRIIGVFGGREINLKDWQPKLFTAGANSILIGNYLTTSGSSVESDLEMITAAGLSY
ncbi:MAG: biotin synthase BioB [Candidatus Margulisbacteria bacterium GWF2_35_9]|nr:MAG: biotin synthase BioB [Candidatus Margulisbacteria bacterium GWF2_35_9]